MQSLHREFLAFFFRLNLIDFGLDKIIFPVDPRAGGVGRIRIMDRADIDFPHPDSPTKARVLPGYKLKLK